MNAMKASDEGMRECERMDGQTPIICNMVCREEQQPVMVGKYR